MKSIESFIGEKQGGPCLIKFIEIYRFFLTFWWFFSLFSLFPPFFILSGSGMDFLWGLPKVVKIPYPGQNFDWTFFENAVKSRIKSIKIFSSQFSHGNKIRKNPYFYRIKFYIFSGFFHFIWLWHAFFENFKFCNFSQFWQKTQKIDKNRYF